MLGLRLELELKMILGLDLSLRLSLGLGIRLELGQELVHRGQVPNSEPCPGSGLWETVGSHRMGPELCPFLCSEISVQTHALVCLLATVV